MYKLLKDRKQLLKICLDVLFESVPVKVTAACQVHRSLGRVTISILDLCLA